MSVDYCVLNKLTTKDRYPLAKINGLLDFFVFRNIIFQTIPKLGLLLDSYYRNILVQNFFHFTFYPV